MAIYDGTPSLRGDDISVEQNSGLLLKHTPGTWDLPMLPSHASVSFP
jgi:hypothetical protein